MDSFRDIDRHRYVNTNNLWVDLRALAEALREREGVLGLPMIRNKKTVDPSDDSSPEVFQLETAMGAAIEVFEGARALQRPAHALRAGQDHRRPARAALGRLRAHGRLPRRASRREREDGAPFVELDPSSSSACATSTARFPEGPPSLVAADRFVVEGDVRFGRGVVARGAVEVRQEGSSPLVIEDGAELGG